MSVPRAVVTHTIDNVKLLYKLCSYCVCVAVGDNALSSRDFENSFAIHIQISFASPVEDTFHVSSRYLSSSWFLASPW